MTANQLNFFDGVARERDRVMTQARNGGCDCPVCGQFVKVYKRTITSFMASQLIEAYLKFGYGQDDSWFHITDLPTASQGGGEFARLRFWDLVEERLHNKGEEGKRNSGYWRVTSRGFMFATGNSMEEKYTLMYNGQCLGSEGELVNIRDCLGEKFDFKELMDRT